MANKDTLIAAIDQFIKVDYGAWQYGGVPFPNTAIYNVNETLPADITFTNQDITDVAAYLDTEYAGYFEYTDWLNALNQELASRIVGNGGEENGNGNVEAGISIFSKPIVLISLAAIALLLMKKSE